MYGFIVFLVRILFEIGSFLFKFIKERWWDCKNKFKDFLVDNFVRVLVLDDMFDNWVCIIEYKFY